MQSLFIKRFVSAGTGKNDFSKRLYEENVVRGEGRLKKLLNTLYVMSETGYLSLDGENVVLLENDKEMGRIPLHNLEEIVSLMGACAERNVSLCYLTPQGKFLARVTGKIKGNVVLRRQQYDSCMDKEKAMDISRNCILAKVYNSRWILERACRDHSLQIDLEKVQRNSCVDLKEKRQVSTMEYLMS